MVLFNKYKLYVFILYCSNFVAVAQLNLEPVRFSHFISNINTFNHLYPQEKVYLHFDNTGYYLGETIWFKAYVVTATEHLPTNLSRVLYVELLNPEGDVVETKKLKVENGQCHGDFQLKDSLFAGYYEVRAYTRYMLNFGNTEYISYTSSIMNNLDSTKMTSEVVGNYIFYPYAADNTYNKNISNGINDRKYPKTTNGWVHPFKKICIENECIFSRVFPVYNLPEKEGDYTLKIMRERPRISEASEPEKKQQKPFDVMFFPEGGNLLTGLPSRIAFKAVSDQGENIEVKGVVRNSRGEEISSLQTTHEGMGSFTLTPDGGTYTAEVYYRDKICTFDLPKSEAAGCVMTVNPMPAGKLLVEIQRNESMPATLGLSIACRGKVAYYDTLTVQSGAPALLNISKDELATGVNQVTLFDATGKILADRLVFINHGEYNQVSLKVDSKKELYKPCEPIQLNFRLTDSLSAPSETTFSLAVRDAEIEDLTYHTDNVVSNLLLSSDLKGYIANPAYYFESDDNQHRYALDLLMLTQGWRRYSWKEMAGVDTFKLKHPVEKGILVDGVLRHGVESNVKDPFIPISHATINLNLMLPDRRILEGECKTDSSGVFKSFVGDFNGTGVLTLMATEKKKKQDFYTITLNRNFSPTPMPGYSFYQTNLPYPKYGDPESATKGGTENTWNSKAHNIQEVVVAAKKRKRLSIDFTHPNYRIFVRDEIDKMIDGNNYLSTSYCELSMVGWVCTSRGISDVTFHVIRNKDLMGRTMYDMDSIYICTDLATRSRYLTKTELEKGYIPDVSIYIKYSDTYHQGPEQKNIRQTKLQGYSYVSEFYSPDYKNNILPEKKDFRRTLYWNPDVKTDSTGRATVSFYNNSTCKRINISAETVTSDGVPLECNY